MVEKYKFNYKKKELKAKVRLRENKNLDKCISQKHNQSLC